MARPGFYGHKKTGLLCCFAERLQVGILSIVAGIKLIDLYFPMCVDCSTRAGRCAGKILIPVRFLSKSKQHTARLVDRCIWEYMWYSFVNLRAFVF